MPQRGKGIGIAEETSDVDQQVAEQCLAFLRIVANARQVNGQVVDAQNLHAPFDPAGQRVAFVPGKIVPDLVAQRRAQVLYMVGQVGTGFALPPTLDPVEEFAQAADDFPRRSHIIDQPGADSGQRHAIITRALRLLSDSDAVVFLDRAQPPAAVGARARKDDAG